MMPYWIWTLIYCAPTTHTLVDSSYCSLSHLELHIHVHVHVLYYMYVAETLGQHWFWLIFTRRNSLRFGCGCSEAPSFDAGRLLLSWRVDCTCITSLEDVHVKMLLSYSWCCLNQSRTCANLGNKRVFAVLQCWCCWALLDAAWASVESVTSSPASAFSSYSSRAPPYSACSSWSRRNSTICLSPSILSQYSTSRRSWSPSHTRCQSP